MLKMVAQKDRFGEALWVRKSLKIGAQKRCQKVEKMIPEWIPNYEKLIPNGCNINAFSAKVILPKTSC